MDYAIIGGITGGVSALITCIVYYVVKAKKNKNK